MKIGLSLPYTYLSSSNTEKDKIFIETLGPVNSALSFLSSEIEYIEISNYDTLTPPEKIVTAVKTIWQQNLKVSLHPSLPWDVENKNLDEIYPWITPLLPEIKKHQENLILNVHALAAPSGKVSKLSEDSIKNLKVITKLIADGGHPVSMAVELNRAKNEIDPCTTYEGVLDICNGVDSSILGIGWDIGHGFANVQNSLIPKTPPKSFLEKITHTHIHDLSFKGNTHWPLTMGVVPLDEYIQLLSKTDYYGLFILEMQPGKFSGHGNARNLLLDSIKILKEAVQRAYN